MRRNSTAPKPDVTRRSIPSPTVQKPKPEKKKISQKEFDRKIKVWGTIIPVLVAIISSVTAIFVAYYSTRSTSKGDPQTQISIKGQQQSQVEAKALSPLSASLVSQTESESTHDPKVEYRITQDDQRAVNQLSKEIKTLTEKYIKSRSKKQKKVLDSQLTRLAEEEAAIMRKYNPDYVPRWSIPEPAKSGIDGMAYYPSYEFKGYQEQEKQNQKSLPSPTPQIFQLAFLVKLLLKSSYLVSITLIALASLLISYLAKRILLSKFEVESSTN